MELVRRFLKLRGVRTRRVRSMKRLNPNAQGPDVWVETGSAAAPRRIGIEVTEYHSDEGVNSGSAGQRRRAFWIRVRGILSRNYFPRYSGFRDYWAGVSFRRNPQFPLKDAKHVARELVEFLSPMRLGVGESREFRRLGRKRPHGDFVGCAYLEKYVERVFFTRHSWSPRRGFLWNQFDSGGVGIPTSKVKKIIDEKADKRRNYELSSLDECWLQICATGRVTGSMLGPWPLPGSPFDEPAVVAAASKSGFDQIEFWECRSGWSYAVRHNSALLRGRSRLGNAANPRSRKRALLIHDTHMSPSP